MTLLELLLVLALLVIFAGMAWPSLQKPFDNQRLRSAGESIRAEWAQARVKAMDTGMIHVFTYNSTGGFQTQPWAGFDAALEGSAATLGAATTSLEGPDATMVSSDKQLPDGIRFGELTALGDVRSQMALASADGSTSGGTAQVRAEQQEITPVLFYPDGTATTARLLLVNSNERYVILELRGLTGVVKVSDVLTAEEIQ